MIWNKQGTSLLVKTALEVDTTGESYYGEQNLHYISIKGDSAIVTLCKSKCAIFMHCLLLKIINVTVI